MIYKDSVLYNLSSKRILQYYLAVPNKDYFKQDFIAGLVYPYIENKNKKKRLIERPDNKLKGIQSRLKRVLAKLDYPEYVFSGVKGRSYPDNARLHVGNKYLYKIDLTAFFPSIAREKVFILFKDKFCMASDIAEILTNFTTIDLDKVSVTDKEKEDINSFLRSKGIKTRNHLISGSPTSQLLSYLANQDMFDKLHSIAHKNGIIMSIYVDDIIFSSKSRISARFRVIVKKIINSYFYRLSARKAKMHTKFYPKRVTGAIINKNGEITISNSIREKIIDRCHKLKSNPQDEQCRRELRGLIEAARQVLPNAYPAIRALAYNPQYKLSQPCHDKHTSSHP